MAKRKKKGRLLKRFFGSLGCLGVLALLVGGGILGYQRIKPLFIPTYQRDRFGSVQTQDITVERGDMADALQLSGFVQTRREETLGFEVGRGEVTSVQVQPQQPVQKGQVLVTLDHEALERDVAEARAELQDAQAELDDLRKPPSATDRLELESQLLQAKETLVKAQEDLAAFDEGEDTPQSRRDEAAEALEKAQADLAVLQEDETRQEQLDYLQWVYNKAEVKHGPMVLIENPSEQDRDIAWLLRIDMLDKADALEAARLQYQMDLKAAEYRVKQAEAALAKLDRELGAGSQEVERLKLATAVEMAEARVSQLEAQLTTLDSQRPDVDIAKAEAQLLKLKWALEEAEAMLSDAEIVAPFDGIVDRVNVTEGDIVNSSSPLLSLFDPNDMYVVLQVSDIDIAKVSEGQEVRLSFDAFGGQQESLLGTVEKVPLYGTLQQGMTVYQVPVSFEPGQMRPRIGMSANAFLPLDLKKDILMVPQMAIQYDREGSYVYVVVGDEMESQHVELGISDGIEVEVVSGLTEGDVVRVPMYGPMGPGYMRY